jgi:hypothetical protein
MSPSGIELGHGVGTRAGACFSGPLSDVTVPATWTPAIAAIR